MKSFDVFGVRVHIFNDGGVKIYAKNREAADKIYEWLLAEGMIPLDKFKCKR